MRYYDVHLHLPSADRKGLEQLLRYSDSSPDLVGANLILNTAQEVELINTHHSELPPCIAVVPYYRAAAEVGLAAPYSGWYKIHPRLSHLDVAKIPQVVEQMLSMNPLPTGVIIDCFPWGKERAYDIGLDLVIQVATAMPSTQVLVTHGGGYQSWAFRAHTVSFKNTLYDFSATFSYYVGSDILKPFQNYLRFIPDRVLFGTDWPHVDPVQQLEECKRLATEIGMSAEELETRLLANAARLWPTTVPQAVTEATG